MLVAQAQADLRRAFVGGGPGVVISALVWLAAAVAESRQGIAPAFTMLFFGGMLIFPLSMLASQILFRRQKASAGNPLGLVALECTIAMIGGLFAAWLFLPFEPRYVFPLAAIAVGTHYAVFKTAYGDRLFWVLGALITLAGLIDIFRVIHLPGGVIAIVGTMELLFGVVLTVRARRMA